MRAFSDTSRLTFDAFCDDNNLRCREGPACTGRIFQFFLEYHMRLQPRSTFLASAGAGLASIALPRGVLAQSTTVRVAGGATDVYSGPFYAGAAGTFTKHGLEIEPSLYNVATAAAAIGAGSLEMSVGDLISGVSAIVAGVPVVILAGGGLYREPADRAGIRPRQPRRRSSRPRTSPERRSACRRWSGSRPRVCAHGCPRMGCRSRACVLRSFRRRVWFRHCNAARSMLHF